LEEEMKVKYKSVNIRDYIGDMYGWIMFKKSGFEKAFYVWDADTVGDVPEHADTVLLKKDYLSIRTVNHDLKYITAIAEYLLGEPYEFNIAIHECGLVTVTRKRKENE
jgi:hypothetical protein